MNTKAHLALCLVTVLLASCCTNETPPAIPQDKAIEDKIDHIIKDMTLVEKIGQMTQLNATAVANGTEITPEGEQLMRTYKVGSVLNTPGDVAQTPEAYDKFISELNTYSSCFIV